MPRAELFLQALGRHFQVKFNPDEPGRPTPQQLLAPAGDATTFDAYFGFHLRGLVDFALGTDTAGSVRLPASFCGIQGLRPTHGAVSSEGCMPLAPSYDTVGWFARDLATLARVARRRMCSW